MKEKERKQGKEPRKKASREERWEERRNVEDENERKKEEKGGEKCSLQNESKTECLLRCEVYLPLHLCLRCGQSTIKVLRCKIVILARGLIRQCSVGEVSFVTVAKRKKQRRDQRAEAAESWASSVSY